LEAEAEAEEERAEPCEGGADERVIAFVEVWDAEAGIDSGGCVERHRWNEGKGRLEAIRCLDRSGETHANKMHTQHLQGRRSGVHERGEYVWPVGVVRKVRGVERKPVSPRGTSRAQWHDNSAVARGAEGEDEGWRGQCERGGRGNAVREGSRRQKGMGHGCANG
jgi:hypothetical protein